MNEMKQIEALLRSWTPRRPSARIERRLFAPPAGVKPRADFRLAWAAPTGVALLLTCLLFTQRTTNTVSASVGSGALFAAALSNQSVAPWLPGNFACEQNAVRESFEWTNGSGWISSNGSLLPLKRAN